jgi:hypothetical protein
MYNLKLPLFVERTITKMENGQKMANAFKT